MAQGGAKVIDRRLYRLLAILVVPVVAGALVLVVDLFLHPLEPGSDAYFGNVWGRWLFGFVLAGINVVIGLLCMRRAPGNPIGLLLILYGAGLTTQSLRASFDPVLAGVLFYVGGFLGWGGFYVLVLLFPNGRPHPRWLGWFVALLVLALSCSVPAYVFGSPELFVGAAAVSITNPYFTPAMGSFYQTLTAVATRGLLPVTLVALPFSVFLRYRKGALKEKAQMRWMLWGMLIMLLLSAAGPLTRALGLVDLAEVLGILGTVLVFVLPPFAIGNAILRHNLYDIDIIIRKTLVYSLLTAILGAIYFGSVILAQQLSRAAIGETRDVAIVVSTLLIAALFSPLRRHIQEMIDRRFFRRKYDAEQTLARFNEALRDDVDIEALKAQLVGVVNETMQPATVGLWVPESTSRRTNKGVSQS
jgi:hypothetical protein